MGVEDGFENEAEKRYEKISKSRHFYGGSAEWREPVGELFAGTNESHTPCSPSTKRPGAADRIALAG